MKRFNKSELMTIAKRKEQEVEIPEWNGSVVIKSLSASVALECQKYLQNGNQEGFVYALVANSVIDDDGNPMFSFDEVKDMDYAVIDRLALEAMTINNIAPDHVQKAREALKNQNRSSM